MSIWPYIEQGDIEGACIDILNNAAEIQAIAGGQPRVSSNMVEYERKARWIEVVRQGGALPWPFKADKPRVDFYCYAETRPVALKIAQVAQAVLLREMGAYVGYGVRITNIKIETGIFRVPDKDTDSPRYSFSLRFTCTPE